MKKTNRHIFNKEQDTFILNNFNKYTEKELTNLLNKTFNINVTLSSVRSRKNRIGATNKIKVKPILNITETQKNFIINNYKYTSNEDLTKKYNKKFNTALVITQIKHLKKKLNLTEGRGNRKKPIYTERINYDGYVEIKIRNKNKKGYDKNYILKSHYILQQHGIKIPKGYKVVYLDGDKTNLDINNLAIVKSSELVFINHNKLYTKDKEFNKTAITIAQLINKANKIKKQAETLYI